jgi:hypothetical protein
MRGRRHLSSSPDRPSDAAAFVVRRAARHSSSPPPRRWFVSWHRPVPDRCSFASPGDREQRHSTWRSHAGLASTRWGRCAARSPPCLELEAANAAPRCGATGGATKTSLDIWWT